MYMLIRITWRWQKILIETRKFNPNRDYLWAIPLKEIDLSQGALKQNPGWDYFLVIEKEAFYHRLQRQSDDRRLYSYLVSTNRYFTFAIG